MALTEPAHIVHNLEYGARQAADNLNLQWFEFGQCPGDGPGWESYAAALAALDELLTAARRVRGEIEAACAPLMPKTATVPGVGLVEKHGTGKKVEWDVDGLRVEVAKVLGLRLSDDPFVTVDDDGCALPTRETVLRAVSRAVEATVDACGMTPSKDWRSGSLGALGIDPKEFKASSFAGWRVRVTPDIVDTEQEAG